jgi:hypothetical protein
MDDGDGCSDGESKAVTAAAYSMTREEGVYTRPQHPSHTYPRRYYTSAPRQIEPHRGRLHVRHFGGWPFLAPRSGGYIRGYSTAAHHRKGADSGGQSKIYLLLGSSALRAPLPLSCINVTIPPFPSLLQPRAIYKPDSESLFPIRYKDSERERCPLCPAHGLTGTPG